MAIHNEKTLDMAHAEDIESATSKDVMERRASLMHGDRALAIVGDERVELTEEDVRSTALYSW